MNSDLSLLKSDYDAKLHYEVSGYKENKLYKFRNIPEDFDPKQYVEMNPDLAYLTNELDIKMHYEVSGYKENKVYKFRSIPEDFDPKQYVEMNPDLAYLTNELDIKMHYENYGFKENRLYKFRNIPEDFDPKQYVEMNSDLSNLNSYHDAKIHYEVYGYKQNRLYKFCNIPEDFDPEQYVEMNPDLAYLTNELDIKMHYEVYGYKENRLYKFRNIPEDFDPKQYIEMNYDLSNLNSDHDAKMHYEVYGYNQNRIYKFQKMDIHKYINKNYDSYLNIKIYTPKNIILNYEGKYEIIHDVSTLNSDDICIFILNDFCINDDDIFELVNLYVNTNSDVLSPTIINNHDELIYFGGIVLNNKTYFFSESDMSYDTFLNNIKKHLNNTTLFYPELFITNKSTYINNYDYSLDVLNHFDKVYKNNEIIKTTPFVIIKKNTNEMFNSNYNNINYLNIKSFHFEKENIYDFMKIDLYKNTHSLKMQNYKYLNNNNNKYILIVENNSLTPDLDCGSMYVYNFIMVLIKLKYNVHFCPINFSYNKYSNILQQLGVNIIFNYPFNISEHLKNNTNVYDYIIIARNFLFNKIYHSVKKYSSKSKIVYITHDLSHLRNDNLFNKIIEFENIKNSDLSLIVSTYEYDYLINNNCKNIYYYPVCYENINRNSGNNISIENSKDFYFIGSQHTPNVECIVFFLDNVFSEILKIKKIKLHVIGQCCKFITNYKSTFDEYLELHGIVSDDQLNTILSTIRLNVVPLLSGAGVKGKILQSLNNQIPTISSSVGVQGLNMTNHYNIIVLDFENKNYSEYAKKFVDYYDNIELLKTISKNGKEYFIKKYSNEKSLEYSKIMFQILDNNTTNEKEEDGEEEEEEEKEKEDEDEKDEEEDEEKEDGDEDEEDGDEDEEDKGEDMDDDKEEEEEEYKDKKKEKEKEEEKIDKKLPKICILYQTYINSDNDNNNLYNFFNNYSNYYSFDLHIIINNDESYEYTIHNLDNLDNIKNKNKNFNFIKGNNELFDFSAYQIGINYLLKNNLIKLYEAIIITNETINKNQEIFLNNIVLETFDFVIKNNVCCGILDSWDINKNYQLNNKEFNKWIRGNFYFMNTKIMQKINYKILYFTGSINNFNHIVIDPELKNKINLWLLNKRYIKYNNNKALKNTKKLEILNEYYFTSELIKCCEIIDIKKIKVLANNYFDSSNFLFYDKIPFKKNGWKNFTDFKKEKILLKKNNKIKLIFYDVEITDGSYLRKYFVEQFKKNKKIKTKSILYKKNIDQSILNNHEKLINRYDIILHHVYYSDLLVNNSIFNITCLRDPVERLISHFHFFDSENIGYFNMVDFKKNDENKFIRYCTFIGNLQFLKFSGYYDKIIKCDNYEKIHSFIKGFKCNCEINTIVYKTLCQMDAVLIFENLNNIIPDNFDKKDLNNYHYYYYYTEDFKKELMEFCEYDYFIYNRFKDTSVENIQSILEYIFDFLSENVKNIKNK